MYVSITGNYIDLSDGSYIFWGPSHCRLGAHHRYGMTHQGEQGCLRLSHWVTHRNHCVARHSHWAAHQYHWVARLTHWAAHHCHGVPTVVLVQEVGIVELTTCIVELTTCIVGPSTWNLGNHLYRGAIHLELG